MSETALLATYVDAKNQVLSASNGVDYAYRSTGDASDATPLVTLQHFRGNLQEIALIRPSIVRKVVLASAAPQGASGMHGWAADVIAATVKPETSAEDYLSVFFTGSEASRAAGQAPSSPPTSMLS